MIFTGLLGGGPSVPFTKDLPVLATVIYLPACFEQIRRVFIRLFFLHLIKLIFTEHFKIVINTFLTKCFFF